MVRAILRLLWVKWQELMRGPEKPGPITFRTEGPKLMANVYVKIPTTAQATDIVKGELTVTSTVDGVTSTLPPVEVPFGQEEVGPFASDFADTQFSVSLVWVDDAGLKSPARDATFSIDLTPPDQPGELSFRVEA